MAPVHSSAICASPVNLAGRLLHPAAYVSQEHLQIYKEPLSALTARWDFSALAQDRLLVNIVLLTQVQLLKGQRMYHNVSATPVSME